MPIIQPPEPWTIGDLDQDLQSEIEQEEHAYQQTGDFASRVQQEADRLVAYESANDPELVDDSSSTLETPVLVSAVDGGKIGSSNTDVGTIYTRRVKYVTSIPEYPETHSEGLLYVISTAALNNSQKQQPWKEVSLFY